MCFLPFRIFLSIPDTFPVKIFARLKKAAEAEKGFNARFLTMAHYCCYIFFLYN